MDRKVYAVVEMTVNVPVRVKRRVIVNVDHRRSARAAIERAASNKDGPEEVVDTTTEEIVEVGFGGEAEDLGSAVDEVIGTKGFDVTIHGVEIEDSK